MPPKKASTISVNPEQEPIFQEKKICLAINRGEGVELKQKAEALGATLTTAITKATFCLVIVDDAEPGLKLRKSREFGIPVVTGHWLLQSISSSKIEPFEPFEIPAVSTGDDTNTQDSGVDVAELNPEAAPRRSTRTRRLLSTSSSSEITKEKSNKKGDDTKAEESDALLNPEASTSSRNNIRKSRSRKADESAGNQPKIKKQKIKECKDEEEEDALELAPEGGSSSSLKKRTKPESERTSAEKDDVKKPKTEPDVLIEEEKQLKKLSHVKGIPSIDENCSVTGTVYVDSQGPWHATLNQSDLTFGVKGNNKFYLIQLIESGPSTYYVLNRWGRVGAKGDMKLFSFFSLEAAKASFEQKFFSKSANRWQDRNNFVAHKKKYTLLAMDFGEDDDEEKATPEDSNDKRDRFVSKLDPRVQELVKLIFDIKIFNETMRSFEIDTKRMPLGKLGKNQVEKGYKILENIQLIIDGKSDENLSELCNQFYTNIPHSFGFRKPPLIRNLEELQAKFDLLQTLSDIQVATKLMEQQKESVHENPIDAKYSTLKNEITALERDGDEWKRIITFLENTSQNKDKFEVFDIFKVNREGEGDRFSKYDNLKERKLLYHGSRVAVFASILSGGLKIMPHSGGRVGRGLYFADIISKSAAYCGVSKGSTGLVLLNEVALGKINSIFQDNPSLMTSPPGFNSVLAEGTFMPDPKDDFSDSGLSRSGHPVTIPQGKLTKRSFTTTFSHNEYLVYNADQVQMKYLLLMKWSSK